MTNPDDAATRPSETGWPSDAAPAATHELEVQPAPLEVTPEPTYDVDAGYDADPVVADEPAFSAESAPDVDQPDAQQPTDEAVVTAPVEAVPPARRPAPGWRSAPVVALLLTTVLMAVATGFVWYRVHQNDLTESARRAGLEASRDAARVLFSYDYRTLDKDFSAGRAITTGRFRAQYTETTSKVVTPVAKEKKAVVKAEVVTAGVVRATPSRVVTIVYVNQVTTSSLTAGPKIDLSRVRMTLAHVGGRWLVANVEAL